MKTKRSTLWLFIGPAMILFLVFFIYPVIRTLLMSFADLKSMSSSITTWKFAGISKYLALSHTSFPHTMKTLIKIWAYCGISVFVISVFFAVVLTSGIKFKGFFRSMLYLPNVIPQLAVGYMWTLYVFSSRFGLLKNLFTALKWEALANYPWTSPDNIFKAMAIAYIFSNVGYFTLMFMAAIEAIPKDMYEAAEIDGAKPIKKFFSLTLPLMRNTLISAITIWTTRVCAFFALSRVFESATTVSPLMYIYDAIFGSESGRTAVGVGAAAAVLVAGLVVLVFLLSNLIPKNHDIDQ